MKPKWITALFLVLVLGILAACGGNGDTPAGVDPTAPPASTPAPTPSATDSPPSQEAFVTPDFSGVDFGGRTFVVADVNPARWDPPPGSSEHANAILARNRWVEDTLNVQIEYRPYNEDEFRGAVLAGDLYAHMIITEMWMVGRNGGSSRLADLSQIPNLNLSAPYWTEFNVANSLQFGDRILGLSSSFSPQSDEIWAMFFNRRIINELGLDCPYELVARNQWTFDRFLEMQRAAQFDLNGDGVLDHSDRYGLAAGHSWDMPLVLFLASGNTISRTNADGSMSFNIDNPQSFAAIDMVRNMMRRGDTFFPSTDLYDSGAHVRAFTEGRALFFAYSFGNPIITPIFQMEDDFGIVPIPRGPQAPDYISWVSHNAPTVSVSISNTELDFTGMVMEALAYRAWHEEANRFDEISLTRLRSDESLETLLSLKDWGRTDFTFMAQQVAGGAHAGLSMLVNVMFEQQDTMEPVSEAEAIQEQVNLAFVEAFEKFRGTWIEPESDEDEDE